MIVLKFIYSEKATKFCKISILILYYVVPVKSKVEISQKILAFSEYMNFKPKVFFWFIDPNVMFFQGIFHEFDALHLQLTQNEVAYFFYFI